MENMKDRDLEICRKIRDRSVRVNADTLSSVLKEGSQLVAT